MRVLVLLALLWSGFSFGETSELDEIRAKAEQGNKVAQFTLAWMYANGKGVPEDNVLAYMWINLAGANGADVSKAKEILVQEMSQADISKAQELTRQYIKDNPAVFPE